MTTARPLAERPGDDAVRMLGDADRPGLERLLAVDPIANAMPIARLALARSIVPMRLGATPFGIGHPHRLRAAVLHGGNLVPIGTDDEALAALGRHLAGLRRDCTSIVGPLPTVRRIWDAVRPAWGEARAVRGHQPLLLLDRPDGLRDVAAGPQVRVLRPDEIDHYLPASAAMFTEELGVSPLVPATAGGYRRRAERMLAAGRAFGVADASGEIVFKADIGALTPHTCQIQGVWVRPRDRGRGLATAAMAQVLLRALDLAPSASLYVND
ncbi:MAG: GNAT family N-acetyltransferase [Jatrophihabitans sp.]|uniref:GNAT family N-acetyltransferase n=1 Tax=Jatrophihabitans sp. TaxID=1932789 RepID=UPI003F7CF4B5